MRDARVYHVVCHGCDYEDTVEGDRVLAATNEIVHWKRTGRAVEYAEIGPGDSPTMRDERSHERLRDPLVPMTPEEGIERFLEYREPNVAKPTFQNNQTTLEQFLAWCHDEEIDNLNDLSGRDLADFVRFRRQQVKPISLQKELSASPLPSGPLTRLPLEHCISV